MCVAFAGLVRKASLMLLVTMMFLVVAVEHGAAQGTAPPFPSQSGPENTLGDQSDSDIWRAIRQGGGGLPGSSEVTDGVLINADGVWWSQLRRPAGPLVRFGSIGIATVLAAIMVFFVARGRLRIDGGRSGRMVARFSLAQRVVHWVMAVVFLLLGFTGLLLLFGRAFLIPIVGKTAFSIIATASMQALNLFGPIFIVSLVALFITFLRGNSPSFSDLKWVVRGGGMFGGHASSGRYNAGEKAWFWTATIAGIALSVSGLVLSFPDVLGTHDLLHRAELLHAIAALVFVGFGIGHIYLGTIGTEGAIDGMISGDVDENWARTHHDLWLDDMKATKGGAADGRD